MAVTINATTTTGLAISSDTSGAIKLQKDGTDVLIANTSGTITVPNATDTLVGKTTTDTLTNKTLTSPSISGPTITGVATFPDGSATAPSIAHSGDTNCGIYFSAADTIDFTTAGTQRAQITSTGDLKFNSGYGSVVTAYACRAWVYFTISGSTATRSGNGNVSSVTYNGTGDYTVNFTTAMPDANYATVQQAGYTGNYYFRLQSSGSYLAGSVRVQIASSAGSLVDPASVGVAVFR